MAGQPGIPNMLLDARAIQGIDPLDAAADQVIMVCDGDARAAVCALIVANGLLEAELRAAHAVTSQGYALGRSRKGGPG